MLHRFLSQQVEGIGLLDLVPTFYRRCTIGQGFVQIRPSCFHTRTSCLPPTISPLSMVLLPASYLPRAFGSKGSPGLESKVSSWAILATGEVPVPDLRNGHSQHPPGFGALPVLTLFPIRPDRLPVHPSQGPEAHESARPRERGGGPVVLLPVKHTCPSNSRMFLTIPHALILGPHFYSIGPHFLIFFLSAIGLLLRRDDRILLMPPSDESPILHAWAAALYPSR